MFWDKIAEKASLEIVETVEDDLLILHGARQRRQGKGAFVSDYL